MIDWLIDIFSEGKGIHVAGGEHRGIVINKDGGVEEEGVQGQPHLCLEFRVFLVNTSTNKHAQVSTNVQMHKCINAQMYKCTNVQMHKLVKL